MKYILTLLVSVVAGTASAQGSLEAMSGYVGTTSSSSTPIYYVQAGPAGWTFQPLTDIEVTALGAWAYATPATGLEIGLWNASGTLLASNTVTTASTAVNQSLYQAIAPLLLSAGQTYYLGAYSPAGSLFCVTVVPGDTNGPDGYATMSSDIQLGSAAVAAPGSGFVFPNSTGNPPGSAIIAPNFEFQPVPEPSVLALAGIGVLVLFSARRQRRS